MKWGWSEREVNMGLLMSYSGPASMSSGLRKNWNNVIASEAKQSRPFKKLKIAASLTPLARTAEAELFSNLLQDRKEKEKNESLHCSCPP
jgi:hypothetical protein